MELVKIEKTDNKYMLDNFELVKQELADLVSYIAPVSDKDTLKVAKKIKADNNKKIKLLKDTLKAYKTDYFEILDSQVAELVEIITNSQEKQVKEIDEYLEKVAQDKRKELVEWIIDENELDHYLEAGEIDLTLEKWSVEKVKEYISSHKIKKEYAIKLFLTEEELNYLQAFIDTLKEVPEIIETYKEVE